MRPKFFFFLIFYIEHQFTLAEEHELEELNDFGGDDYAVDYFAEDDYEEDFGNDNDPETL
jgi:hypothetical protein